MRRQLSGEWLTTSARLQSSTLPLTLSCPSRALARAMATLGVASATGDAASSLWRAEALRQVLLGELEVVLTQWRRQLKWSLRLKLVRPLSSPLSSSPAASPALAFPEHSVASLCS